MALPQKAIEQLSRDPVRTPGWSSRLLMFTSAVFFLSVAIGLGVRFGYIPILQKQLVAVKKEIADFETRTPLAEQEKIITFYSQIENLKNLIRTQNLASAFFPWLESKTHTSVSFKSLRLDPVKKEAQLQGNARSLRDVAEQLAAIEYVPEVQSIQFGSASFSEKDFWSFGVTIIFKPAFFNTTAGFVAPGEDTQEEPQ